MILETDPATIASRVSMRGADSDVPLAQQTLSQAFASARGTADELVVEVGRVSKHSGSVSVRSEVALNNTWACVYFVPSIAALAAN